MIEHEMKSRDGTGRAPWPAQAASVCRCAVEAARGAILAPGDEPSVYSMGYGPSFAADDAEWALTA